jgi:hypothetical protein
MVRLVLILIFFLISLLCLFPAPMFHLWLLSIPATEFSWVFILIVTLLLFFRDLPVTDGEGVRCGEGDG